MQIQLSEQSALPLREQIIRAIRGMVLQGDLTAHSRLPSIRQLARDQRVGVVTVQRAFEDLEREGMLYAQRGKGYFVAPIPPASREVEARRRARQILAPALGEVRTLGLDEDAIVSIVRAIARGDTEP